MVGVNIFHNHLPPCLRSHLGTNWQPGAVLLVQVEAHGLQLILEDVLTSPGYQQGKNFVKDTGRLRKKDVIIKERAALNTLYNYIFAGSSATSLSSQATAILIARKILSPSGLKCIGLFFQKGRLAHPAKKQALVVVR